VPFLGQLSFSRCAVGSKRHRVCLRAGRLTPGVDLKALAADHPVRPGPDAEHPVPNELVTPVAADSELPATSALVPTPAQRDVHPAFAEQSQAAPCEQDDYHHRGDEDQADDPSHVHGPAARQPGSGRLACGAEPACRSGLGFLVTLVEFGLACATSISSASSADSASTLTPSPVTERKPPCTAAINGLVLGGDDLDNATLDELAEHRLVAGHDADLALGRLGNHQRGRTGPQATFHGDQLDGHLSHGISFVGRR